MFHIDPVLLHFLKLQAEIWPDGGLAWPLFFFLPRGYVSIPHQQAAGWLLSPAANLQ